MKLKSIKKLKNNKYELVFDSETKLSLYDDIIIKYMLITNKEIESQTLEKIIKENDTLESYYLALKYATKKMRSEKEVRFYLEGKEFNISDIDNVIDRLKKENILNDKIYIEAYINDAINLSSAGYYKILKDLINKGIEEEKITTCLDIIDENVWLDKLNKLIIKKIKSNKKYTGRLLKEKIIYDLGGQGYLKEMILNVLGNYNLDNSNNLEKEYQKTKNKLEKKYSGEKLEYYTKIKLIQKGYSSEEINNLIV